MVSPAWSACLNSSVTDPFADLAEKVHGVEGVLREIANLDPKSQIRLLFVRFREDEPQVANFVELLADQLTNYVIPLRKRRAAYQAGISSPSGGDAARIAGLVREARRLLVAYDKEHPGRYGEIGELIAYVVAQHFLRAPQLCSKIALKTNAAMLVHGVDGLHARMEPDGTVSFFLLESKVVPDPAAASREFFGSVKKYREDRAAQLNELRLVLDLSNLDALEGDARDRAKAYFNEYADGADVLNRREIHVGSLVFNEDAYTKKLPRDLSAPISIHEDKFESLYKEKHTGFARNRDKHAASAGVDPNGCIAFMIAVPDVASLKALFSEVCK